MRTQWWCRAYGCAVSALIASAVQAFEKCVHAWRTWRGIDWHMFMPPLLLLVQMSAVLQLMLQLLP